MPKLYDFFADESGAATVDWVVLTAATIGIGTAAVNAVSSSVGTATGNLSASLNTETGGSSNNTTNSNGDGDAEAFVETHYDQPEDDPNS